MKTAHTKQDFDNLLFDAFELVSDTAQKAQRRLEAIQNGTASPNGKNQQEVLKLYRKKLVGAIAELDKFIEE